MYGVHGYVYVSTVWDAIYIWSRTIQCAEKLACASFQHLSFSFVLTRIIKKTFFLVLLFLNGILLGKRAQSSYLLKSEYYKHWRRYKFSFSGLTAASYFHYLQAGVSSQHHGHILEYFFYWWYYILLKRSLNYICFVQLLCFFLFLLFYTFF